MKKHLFLLVLFVINSVSVNCQDTSANHKPYAIPASVTEKVEPPPLEDNKSESPAVKIADKKTVSISNISNKKWLFLGDSITAKKTSSGWVAKFKELVSANESSYIQAVGGAKWCDDEVGITYEGRPSRSQNYVGNQVAWCKRIGFASDAFDCIIIFAGTNDTNSDYPTDDSIELQFYKGDTLKPLSEVDRTTWAGAIRWTVQSLRAMYPSAVIFLVTPLQRKTAEDGVTTKDMYPTIMKKRETIIKMAHRMGCYCIDMSEINITDMGRDYADGLHPNDASTTKIADYIFRKILPIMCDYNLE